MSAAEKINFPDKVNDDISVNPNIRQHLRIVGLETGDDFSFEDAIDFLEKPSEAEAEAEDKMDENQKDESKANRVKRQLKLLRRTRADVLEIMDVDALDKVHALAEKIAFAEDAFARNEKTVIRNRILANTPLEWSGNKEADLKKLGERANQYINSIISSFFPDHHDFRMNNEVALCHDPATLLLMSYDNSQSRKAKFEAARKFLIMKMFGEMDNHKEKEIDNNEAMKDMMAFMNQRMIQMPEGFRKGQTLKRYLVHLHEPGTFKTIESRIVDAEKLKEITLRPYEKVTPLAMRQTLIERPDEVPIVIEHTIDGREKSDESRGNKMIREDAEIGEQDVDLNGFEMVFKNKEEWNAYFAKLLKEIQLDVIFNLEKLLEKANTYPEIVEIQKRIESLRKAKLVTVYKNDTDGSKKIFGMYLSTKADGESEITLENEEELENTKELFKVLAAKGRSEEAKEKFKKELKDIDTTIVLHDMKDYMNGGVFKGKSKASGKVQMCKFRMDLHRSDGRIHSYEYQVYLPGAYADAKFKKGSSWKEYNINRFFETGMDDLLFPKKIYNSNRVNDQKEAIARAHRELWNGHANAEKSIYEIREAANQLTFGFNILN